MSINGSDFLNEPWNTTFSPFTNLFEQFMSGGGMLFYLFVLSIIAVALFVKTREPTIVSMYMITSGLLFSAGGIFIGATSMSMVFVVFAALGLVSLFVSLFFKR